MVPPFSVLDARQGYWQDRKRAWIAVGIKSELGRGGEGNLLGLESAEQARGRWKSSPGGSPRPAADYSNKQRGDRSGKAISRETLGQTAISWHGRKQWLKALRTGHHKVTANGDHRQQNQRGFGQRQEPAKMFRGGLYAKASTHERKPSERETNTGCRSKVAVVPVGDAGAMRNRDAQTAAHPGIGNSGETVQALGEVMIGIE